MKDYEFLEECELIENKHRQTQTYVFETLFL